MDEEDYEYESDEEVEWTEEMLDMEQGDYLSIVWIKGGRRRLRV